MGQKRKSTRQLRADKERCMAPPDDLKDQGNIVGSRIREMLAVGPLVIKDETALEQVESLFTLDLLAKSIDANPRRQLKRRPTIATVKEVRLNQSYDDHTTKKRRTRQHRENIHCSEESPRLDSPDTETGEEGDGSAEACQGSEEPHISRQILGQCKMSTSTLSSPSSTSGGELTPPSQASLVHDAVPHNTVLNRRHSSVKGSSIDRTQSCSASVHAFKTETSTTSTGIPFEKTNPLPRKSQEIVIDVLDILSKPTRKHNGELFKRGYIYILQDTSAPGFVKIGHTTQRAAIRKKQIAYCHTQNIEWVAGEGLVKVPYHERLERVIHADLYNERYHFVCNCRSKHHHSNNGADESEIFTKHGEWFKISPQEAKAKVEMWKAWMNQSPYNQLGDRADPGKLKDDFRRRVDYCYEHEVSETEDRWARFMTPFYMSEMD